MPANITEEQRPRVHHCGSVECCKLLIWLFMWSPSGWLYPYTSCAIISFFVPAHVIKSRRIHTYLLTHSLTSWSRVLEKLTGLQPVTKFPAFYRTWRFITAFTSARHLSVSWASSIQLCLQILGNKDTVSLWGVVSPSSNPQAGGPTLVGCPQLLIKYIHCYPPYWRAFLHLQPEDTPCHGDRDPLITWSRGIHKGRKKWYRQK
jgi:hypothetical protein